MQTINRQQTISKLNQFHEKLSQHIKQISIRKEQPTKEYQYAIYQPKKIDSASQTILEKLPIKNVIGVKQRQQLNDSKRGMRMTELRQIVDDTFKHYFRVTKQKEVQMQRQVEKIKTYSQTLQAQLSLKDSQIDKLKNNLLKNSQQLQKPYEELKSSTQQWQKKHENDQNQIKNLQKFIQDQKQSQRLTSLVDQQENDLLAKSKRIIELQELYKNSQHLVDAMSKEQVKLSSQLQQVENDLKKKTSYIEYIEDLYLSVLRENSKLQHQVDYFSSEIQSLNQSIKNLNEDIVLVSSQASYYEKLTKILINSIQVIQLKRKETEVKEDKDEQNLLESEINSAYLTIQRFGEHYLTEEINYNISIQTLNKISQENLQSQKSILNQKQDDQANLKSFFKACLESVIQNQKQQSKKQSLRNSIQSSSKKSSNSSRDLKYEKLHILMKSNTLSKESNTNQSPQQKNSDSNQINHKQNQISPSQPLYQVIKSQPSYSHLPNLPIIDPFFSLSPYSQKDQIKQIFDRLSPQSELSDRPPSFGKDHSDQLPQESDKQHFETETPYFSEISLSGSQLRQESPENLIMTQSVPMKIFDHESLIGTDGLKRKQISQQMSSCEVPNFKIFKSEKASEQIIAIDQKMEDEQISHDDISGQANERKNPNEVHNNLETKYSGWKFASCQLSKDQNGMETNEKQKESTKFIKKHQSMTNYNGGQPLSPSCLKEQSDCHIMIEKNKKHPKKKLQFRLPPPNETRKSNLYDLERELVHNIQTHNSMWRRLERQKFHKILGCPKLSQRLADLIQRQSTLEQQIIVIQHQHHTNPASLSGLNANQKEMDTHSTHYIISDELQLMVELERLIKDTYEWILLVDRLNRREFEKHQRLVGRIRQKRTKTGVHHNKFKEKESNEDRYETDQLFDFDQEKSVYSEGDSPRGAGEVDHFDISPFDHIEVPQKHEDIHSLEKLFKQGQQISEISSVKNQSQVSSFINPRSEFVNILYSKNYIRVQEQELHPHAAYSPHDNIEYNPLNPFHLITATSTVKAKDHITSHQHVIMTHQQMGQQNRCDEKSIKSVRNVSSRQKQNCRLLQKRIVQVTTYYKKIIEKMLEDDKKKSLKMQRDFNKALTMAIKLKSPSTTNSPSSPKQIDSTSIKLVQSTQPKTSLSQIKSPPSKLQSRSLTQITLLSQKINQKDEIVQEKIESYEKKIDQLTLKNDEMKASLASKSESIEDLEKKLKLQKVQNQKIDKKCEELKKEVQNLKAKYKKIKNEFSQFMHKLVAKQKEPNTRIEFKKKPSVSYDDPTQLSMPLHVPGLIKYAQSLNFQENSPISSIEKGDIKNVKEILESQQQSEKHESENNIKVEQVIKSEQSTQTQSVEDQPTTKLQEGQTVKLLAEIQSKDETIKSLTRDIEEHKITIIQLSKQIQRLKEQSTELNSNIESLSIQVSQKQVEISELANSLKSIQVFQKKLKEKLTQAQEKIKEYETQKHLNQSQVFLTPQKQPILLKQSNELKNIRTMTPIPPINHINLSNSSQPDKQPHIARVKRKKSNDSMGSIGEKFFDLESEKEFNNIFQSSKQMDDKLKKKQMQINFYETARRLEQQRMEKNSRKLAKTQMQIIKK